MGFSIPILQLRHKSALIYYQYQQTGPKYKNQHRQRNIEKQKQNAYSGKLSQHAKKRLKKALTLMVQSCKGRWLYNEVSKKVVFHRLAFITLTISDPTELLTAEEAYKKVFSHFLAWLRRTKKVNTYIWKAELQKNGQIHYHITTPAFINYQELRDKWNNLQRKAGLLDRYEKENGHTDANSTDIHSVKNIKDLPAYMIKYMCKEEDHSPTARANADKEFKNCAANVLGCILSGVPICTKANREPKGKVWDCSNNLSRAKYHSLPMTSDHHYFIEQAEANDLCEVYHDERFSLIKFHEPPEEYLLTKAEYKKYKEHLRIISNSIVYNDPEFNFHDEVIT